MAKRSKPAVNVLLVIVSSFIAILVGEFVIGEFLPQKTLFPRYRMSDQYRVMFPSNSQLIHSQGGCWRFSYQTNELGHRGELLPVEATAGTTNVVAVGDSFTFGMGVNDGIVYTNALQKNLGKRYSVLNAGMSGWGLDSEIKRYYEIFATYQPRYVVLQFTQNDPADTYNGVTTIANGQFRFSALSDIKPRWQQILSESEILQNSQIYAAARNLFETLQSDTESSPQETGLREDHYVELLKLFAQRLKIDKATLLFVSVTHRHREKNQYHYDIEHFTGIQAAITDLRKADLIRYVELPVEELAAYPGSPESHQWNEAHHKIVGTEIAKAILQLEAERKI